MRKSINSKKSQASKQKRNQLYLGLGLTLLLLFSIFGIMASSFGKETEQEKLTYKGFELIKKNSIYQLNVYGRQFYLAENPNNLTQLNVNMNITKTLPQYSGKPLYIDALDYGVNQEIYQNIQGYPLRIQNACYDKNNCPSEEFPIKDCSENLIIIKESKTSKIYENESCVFIEGPSEDLIKLTDLFILKIMGLN